MSIAFNKVVRRVRTTNKDVMALVEERQAEMNTCMSTLMGRVDDMDKRIGRLEFEAT